MPPTEPTERTPAPLPVRRPRPLVSLDELLADVTSREPMKTAESLSSATFERVVIDGDRYVVKYLHCEDDWVMRASGDLTCRPAALWAAGLFDALPPQIDATVAGVAGGLGRHGWGTAVLMRDVAEHLVPDGEQKVDAEVHEQFLANMAAFHAHFWGFVDDIGLAPTTNRLFLLSPWTTAAEAAYGSGETIPRLIGEGWARLPEVSPRAGSLALDLLAEPSALVAALDATPRTLVHSDWKLGNLGAYPDGRTILLDWAFPGAGAGAADLAWYLGVNCDRLTISKDAAIDHYRDALEAHGIDTDPWWDEQLGLSLIGHFLQMGWSKALNGPNEELAWWEARVLDAARFL